jgi:hypothetical protein
MKASSLVMLLALVVPSVWSQNRRIRQQAVSYAKALDVRTFEPSLPSQRLDDFLLSGPAHLDKVRWQPDACGATLDPSRPDFGPLCVEVSFYRGGLWGNFRLWVGNLEEGVHGSPQLQLIAVGKEGSIIPTASSERLSDIPRILDEAASSRVSAAERQREAVVWKLYHEVVTHGSIGIPYGAERAAIWPLLSKRLIKILETGQACGSDWDRQNPGPDPSTASRGEPLPILKPGFPWLEENLFSGWNEESAPSWAVVERSEAQKDRSYLVYVRLAYQDHGPPDQPSTFPPMHLQAVATVISENRRLVIDDILLVFDGDESTEGKTHRLSDTFVGCDGPHWIGLATTNR